MSRVLLDLERLIALSDAMLAAAEAQEWETLTRLGDERRSLSELLPADLSAHLPPHEMPAARAGIERSQGIEARILSLVDERQESLRILLREPAH